jgi:hypothetical protein
MLWHFPSVEDSQRFVERKPYQPTAESAFVIKYRDMASGREQAIFYSDNCPLRIAKHAVRDEIEQAVISLRPNIK